MNLDVGVRPFRPGDAEAVAAIAMANADAQAWKRLEDRYGLSGGRPWLDHVLPPLLAAARGEPRRFLLAEQGGLAAGYALYGVQTATRLGDIWEFALLPGASAADVGAVLLAAALAGLSQEGVIAVRAYREAGQTVLGEVFEAGGLTEFLRNVYYARDLAGIGSPLAGPALIRAYRPEDDPRILEFSREAWREVAAARRLESLFGVLGGQPWWEHKFGPMLDGAKRNPDRFLVAEIEGRPVGYASFSLDEENRIGHVGNNAVDPAQGGRGIGSALHQEVLWRLKMAGMRIARVMTGEQPSQAPARRLYERHGFREIKRDVTYIRTMETRP